MANTKYMKWIQQHKTVLVLLLLAYLFSVGVRLLWVYQNGDMESYRHNGSFMINTNDGYFWAEGARDILQGGHQEYDRSPVRQAASQLTAFVAQVLPFDFEAIIFYMPVFLGSLIVVPIILLARDIQETASGFVAALLASIAWSYYNRTMAGYYDTDMLNIVLPTVLLWSLVGAYQTRLRMYQLIAALDILVYRWWYPQSYALEFAFIVFILLYAGFRVYKKHSIRYEIELITLMLLATLMTDGLIRLGLVIVLYLLFTREKAGKYLYLFFGVSVAAFFITGGFDPIWNKLQGYVFQNTTVTSQEDLRLHFFTVMQTIREAGNISFELFANRISGHQITFVLSLAGYVWLCYKHRIMLLALPMVGLGFLALNSGLRFTIYAVPIMALGIGFLIMQTTSYMRHRSLRYIAAGGLSILILLPNLLHVKRYNSHIGPVFNKQEVQLLEKFGNMAQREDYVVTWWDYGYPVRYYSDVKTLIDGGKHRGSANFPVSFVLTQSQLAAAQMARLEVEYTERDYARKEKNRDLPEEQREPIAPTIEQMTLNHGFKDTNLFLQSLQLERIKLPEKTRDIYLYLPYRMLSIYPTVGLFSNLDLMTGKSYERPFFYMTQQVKQDRQFLYFAKNLKMDKKEAVLQIGDSSVPVKRFVQTRYEQSGLQTKVQRFHAQGLNVLFLKSYNTFVIVDEQTYNSLYFQLYILENYDKTLFEPIILSPWAKIYKLKI